MNKHIFITYVEQDPNGDCTGTIIRFEDREKNEYHTWLPNSETAQLAKELNEILMENLYKIEEEE